jgi:hypothetical protein
MYFIDKVQAIIASLPLPEVHCSVFDSSSTEDVEYQLATFNAVSQEHVSSCRPIKSSPAVDIYPSSVFGSVYPVIVPYVTDLINLSLTTGDFPKNLKIATITPLLKKATLSSSDYKSYRPVSNLPFISKVLETVVAEQLLEYTSDHNLLCPYQSAYRKHHSCETALLDISSQILTELDKGRSVFLVLLDLSAAFDTINHDLLLSRLQNDFNITGIAPQWEICSIQQT